MNELLIYAGKVAATTSAFYLLYRFTLRRETFHSLNRIFLNFAVIVSFVVPFCVITTHFVSFERTITKPAQELLEYAPAYIQSAITTQNTTIEWSSILMLILLLGVAVMTVYTIICTLKIGSLLKLLASDSKIIRHTDGIRLYVTNREIVPFSWFNTIVISQDDYRDNAEMIIAHERAHAKLYHSFDTVFINLCCAVQWFNPLMWMLRADLKSIHEYQADNYVLTKGFNAKQYQLLLINKAVGYKSHSIANSLNHSTLKNRITMMLSKKSTAAHSLKLLCALPLAALSLTMFAQHNTVVTHVNPQSEDTQSSSSGKKNFRFSPIFEQGTVKSKFSSGKHSGVDIALPQDALIYALMDGVVKNAVYNKNGKGNQVILAHNNGLESEYCHLASFCVTPGEAVKAGAQIGKAGNTGFSTGTHLHFEVREDGKNIDPESFLPILKNKVKADSAENFAGILKYYINGVDSIVQVNSSTKTINLYINNTGQITIDGKHFDKNYTEIENYLIKEVKQHKSNRIISLTFEKGTSDRELLTDADNLKSILRRVGTVMVKYKNSITII